MEPSELREKTHSREKKNKIAREQKLSSTQHKQYSFSTSAKCLATRNYSSRTISVPARGISRHITYYIPRTAARKYSRQRADTRDEASREISRQREDKKADTCTDMEVHSGNSQDVVIRIDYSSTRVLATQMRNERQMSPDTCIQKLGRTGTFTR